MNTRIEILRYLFKDLIYMARKPRSIDCTKLSINKFNHLWIEWYDQLLKKNVCASRICYKK